MKDWNSQCGEAHGPNWLKWLGHLKGTAAAGFELGTWKGDSAEWMLANIFTAQHATYECCDTFEGSEEHRLAGVDCSSLEQETRARLKPFGSRVKIHKRTSISFLTALSVQRQFGNYDQNYDFAYIDAAHDAMNVLRDSVLAFEVLRPGAIIVWDDYTWDAMPDMLDRPMMAIDAFLECFGRRLEVIGMGYQVAARKIE